MENLFQWFTVNISWTLPTVYMTLMVIIGILLYAHLGHNFNIVCMVEASFCLLYIFFIYIPFYASLKQEFATLIAFITAFILYGTFGIFGFGRGGVGDK